MKTKTRKLISTFLIGSIYTSLSFAQGPSIAIQPNLRDDVISLGIKQGDEGKLYFVDEGFRQGVMERSGIGSLVTVVPPNVQLGPLYSVIQIKGSPAVLNQIPDQNFGEFIQALILSDPEFFAHRSVESKNLYAKLIQVLSPWNEAHASGPGPLKQLWAKVLKLVGKFRRVRPEPLPFPNGAPRFPRLTIRKGTIRANEQAEYTSEMFYETITLAGEKLGVTGSKLVQKNHNGSIITIEITDIIPGGN